MWKINQSHALLNTENICIIQVTSCVRHCQKSKDIVNKTSKYKLKIIDWIFLYI